MIFYFCFLTLYDIQYASELLFVAFFNYNLNSKNIPLSRHPLPPFFSAGHPNENMSFYETIMNYNILSRTEIPITIWYIFIYISKRKIAW